MAVVVHLRRVSQWNKKIVQRGFSLSERGGKGKSWNELLMVGLELEILRWLVQLEILRSLASQGPRTQLVSRPWFLSTISLSKGTRSHARKGRSPGLGQQNNKIAWSTLLYQKIRKCSKNDEDMWNGCTAWRGSRWLKSGKSWASKLIKTVRDYIITHWTELESTGPY